MEEEQKNIQPEEENLPKTPAAELPDDVEEVATKEDVEAFMRERRKARAEKKAVVEKENPEVEEYLSEEDKIDPYLDPGHRNKHRTIKKRERA